MDLEKFNRQVANEMSAIGAFILSHDSASSEASSVRTSMMDSLKSGMFTDRGHREIWSVIVSLVLEGVTPDLVMIAGKLRSNVQVDASETIEKLVACADSTPNWNNGAAYAKNLADFWRRRTISDALSKVAKDIQSLDGQETFDPMEALNKAFRAICESADGATVEYLMSFLDAAMEMRPTLTAPIITRIATLDGNINLFTPGELTILAARPSVGKSTLARQICANASVKGDILIFSMEVSPQILSLQFACEVAGVVYHDYTRGSVTDDQVLKVSMCGEDPNLKRIHVFCGTQPSTLDVAMALTNLKVRGREVAAVVIDYLGLMKHEKAERHDISIGNTTRSLKQLAVKRNVPIILLCQLNREVEKRGGSSECDRPRLADLRDSGNIEQDADNVLFLWRRERGDEYLKVESRTLTVAKHRNGECVEMDLLFDKTAGRFSEQRPQAEPFDPKRYKTDERGGTV